MVRIEPNNQNGLTKTSAADCFQIRSISQEGLMHKLGEVDKALLNEIKLAVSVVIDL